MDQTDDKDVMLQGEERTNNLRFGNTNMQSPCKYIGYIFVKI